MAFQVDNLINVIKTIKNATITLIIVDGVVEDFRIKRVKEQERKIYRR